MENSKKKSFLVKSKTHFLSSKKKYLPRIEASRRTTSTSIHSILTNLSIENPGRQTADKKLCQNQFVDKVQVCTVELCTYNCSLCIFASIAVILIALCCVFVKFLANIQIAEKSNKQFVHMKGQLICCLDSLQHEQNKFNLMQTLKRCATSSLIKSLNNIEVEVKRVKSIEKICLPVAYVAIAMYDYNWLQQNELMNITITDKNGFFEITGNISSITKIDPFIRINHKCNRDPNLVNVMSSFLNTALVFRQSSYIIPRKYINNGIYETFPLNLQIIGWRDFNFIRFFYDIQ